MDDASRRSTLARRAGSCTGFREAALRDESNHGGATSPVPHQRRRLPYEPVRLEPALWM
jgi:hypothetical protein